MEFTESNTMTSLPSKQQTTSSSLTCVRSNENQPIAKYPTKLVETPSPWNSFSQHYLIPDKKHNSPEWNLGEYNSLPEIPLLYIREKTSSVILNKTPGEVSRRIVLGAKLMSATGNYDDMQVR